MTDKSRTKIEILQDLSDARAEIMQLAKALPPAKQFEVFLGEWSAADLLAHLIGWDYANRAAAEELLEGKLPGFYAFKDRDWRSYNAQLVARYKKTDFSVLLADVERVHQSLLDRLAQMSEEDLVKDRGVRFKGWKVTIERLLKAEAGDERIHARQLRQFLES